MVSINKQLQLLLKNKYVLYIVFFLAITNVLGFISLGDYNSLTFFIALMLISSYFSKNMIVNLLISIVFTNTFFVGRKIEAMTNKKTTDDDSDMKTDSDDTLPNNTENKKNGNNGNNNLEGKGKNKNSNGNGASNKKESFGQRNVPHSQPASLDEDDDIDVGKRIDYASTLEQAYDNLQGMIGKDGISGLTKDTEKLINQQKSLMGTLNEMIPFIKSTKETLGSFDMGDINKNLGGISEMLGGMGMGTKKA